MGYVHKLEAHYRDMQDIEFTVEKGRLWMLQTRNGKRTAKAALKIAVDLAQRRQAHAAKRRSNASTPPRSTSFCTRHSIPKAAARHPRDRPAGLAGRRLRRSRLRRRRSRTSGGRRPRSHPGPRRNQPRRHPRHARRPRHPDRPRRHDQPRGGRRPRHGPALRLGRRRPARRLRQASPHRGRPNRSRKGEIITIDGSTGQVMKGRVAMIQPELSGDFANTDDLGRRLPPHEGARQRRNPGRRQGTPANSAPKASASAAPSTCSSTPNASPPSAR